MANIWLLTEESPKISTVQEILMCFSNDFGYPIRLNNGISINALYKPDHSFNFSYVVEGITFNSIDNIYLCCASGNSSFGDYLLFLQDQAPTENGSDIPLMIIEETKTSDKESRNTGVYQRAIKFVYARHFYPTTNLYMLYCNDYGPDHSNPTDTNIFGTNVLLTLGVKIVGKEPYMHHYHAYTNLNELIEAKNNMALPRNGIPIRIDTSNPNCIRISGRLIKDGRLSHDPNIGTLSLIAAGIRHFGFLGDIEITQHGLNQAIINRARGNKFLYVSSLLNISLFGLTNRHLALPAQYWHYEKNSEKVASIYLHLIAEKYGLKAIYQNHAGSERGYFINSNNTALAVKKYITGTRTKLPIPDVVLRDPISELITVIEGKQTSTLAAGLSEVDSYGIIQTDYFLSANPDINGYPGSTLYNALTIFGGDSTTLPHNRVLLYINSSGQIIVNTSAPTVWLDIFHREGIM